METTDYMNFKAEAVIVGAGEFPRDAMALHWLNVCDKIVCCDGATNRFIEEGFRPWRIVGDCDSLSQENKDKFKEIVRYNPDQETNDQTKAVEYLADRGIREIVILGATGLREDHTLGNISLLTDYLKRGIIARIYTNYGVFVPVKDELRFKCPEGTQVSIFNFGAIGMKGEGLLYPLRDFDNLWQGTLNETVGESFTIHADGYYLIFVNYPG